MKVAYMLGSLGRGGTETLMLDVFRGASRAGFDFIGVHRKDGQYKDAFYATDPEFVCLSPKFPFNPFYLLKLRRLFLCKGITIVHAQQFLDCVYALLATLFTDIKVVETFHGYDYSYGSWDRLMLKFGIRHASALCFVSKAQQKHYSTKYRIKNEQKCHVIYNGIDFSKLDKQMSDSTLPDMSKGLKMAMVGNFVEVRNQMLVCEFLKLLSERRIMYDFYFIGARSSSEPWRYDKCVGFCEKNGISEYVHFLGSRDDVPAILRQMDAFVYNTDHDTFGIAMVEAIACGLPTFVNDWCVVKEITQNGSLATLFSSGSAEDLLNKFLDFIENVPAWKENAKNNAELIRKLYSIEAYMKRVKGVYEGL